MFFLRSSEMKIPGMLMKLGVVIDARLPLCDRYL
jgi:hypothetical protein